MKTTCPACGAVTSLDVLIGHEGARDAVMAALATPAPIGKPLVMYLALFRPPRRSLSFDRVASLLGELQPMIEAARVERNGRTWSAPQEYWHMALAEMIAKRDKLTLPLKSHGYLLEIICGYGLKAEGKSETAAEQQRGGRTQTGAAALKSVDEVLGKPTTGKARAPMPAHVKQAVKRKGVNDGNR